MSPRWLSTRAQVRADRAAIDARLEDLAAVPLADDASQDELAARILPRKTKAVETPNARLPEAPPSEALR